MSTLGENIRYYRKLRGMSRPELADKIGKTRSSIGHYEQNRREPDFATLDDIASALGIETIDLMIDLEDLTPENEPANKIKVVPASLTKPESELVDIYNSLNNKGQTVLINTARGIASNPEYKKAGMSSDEVMA